MPHRTNTDATRNFVVQAQLKRWLSEVSTIADATCGGGSVYYMLALLTTSGDSSEKVLGGTEAGSSQTVSLHRVIILPKLLVVCTIYKVVIIYQATQKSRHNPRRSALFWFLGSGTSKGLRSVGLKRRGFQALSCSRSMLAS